MIIKTYQDFITLTSSAASVQTPSMPRRADDPDWVFFRGFGAKRREDVVAEEVSSTCPQSISESYKYRISGYVQ